MRFKILSLPAAMLLLAACGSTPDESATSNTGGETAGVNDGNTAGVVEIVEGSEQDLVVNIGNSVFFATDRSDLSSDAQSTLAKQAAWLLQYPQVTVQIEGHCDERGTREYNLALGERRANSVKEYLTSLGVAAGRISTISYGKERPIVEGSTPEAWAQNRRGITRIVGGASS